MSSKKYTLAELVEGLDVTIQGDPHCLIHGLATIHHAHSGQVTFLTNASYKKHLSTTQASAVILNEVDAAECSTNIIISDNPYFTYAQIARVFESKKYYASGIHPTAILGEDCEIDSSASIGINCVLGDCVNIAAGVVIGPNCVIGDAVTIGLDTFIDARTVIHDRVSIGSCVRIASGVVIGSDGFGYAQDNGKWLKIPQLGSVMIGDEVEIGANTTIDRGAIEDTIIERGVKLDNQIQIGHNVRIGEHTIIAGCVGIAGSAVIGKHCMIGGAACITGHVTIADHVVITGMTGVSKSIRAPGMYSSGVAGIVTTEEWLKNSARFNRLEHWIERVKKLEMQLQRELEAVED